MPQIPIDDLPEPQPYTKKRTGHIFCHGVTAPVVVTTNPLGTTVRLPKPEEPVETLGALLRDISAILSKEQVNDLVAKKVVKL